MTIMKMQIAFKFENLIMPIRGLFIENSQFFFISLNNIVMLQIYYFETKQNTPKLLIGHIDMSKAIDTIVNVLNKELRHICGTKYPFVFYL